MIILGLTGSIGMGKSVAARNFRRLGVPVHDADQTVHDLMAPAGAAFPEIADRFPGVMEEGRINRKRLGDLAFRDTENLQRLESILHPLVRAHKSRFLGSAARRRCPVVVLDVPLLYETGGDKECDAVVVVTAPAFVQRARVLSRPGMTVEKLDAILERQAPDREKRRRADFLVQTGIGKLESLTAIRKIVAIAKSWRGRRRPAPPNRRDR